MRVFPSLGRRRWLTIIGTVGLALYCAIFMAATLSERGFIRNGSIPPPDAIVPADAFAAAPELKTPPVFADRFLNYDVVERLNCSPVFHAEAAPASTVWLSLNAPCHGAGAVQLRYGPLIVNQETDAFGQWRVRLPAFFPVSTFDLTFDGMRQTLGVDVPDAQIYEHVMLQWQGPQTFSINAFEFGALENGKGHVSNSSPSGPDAALTGEGGFLTRLIGTDGSGFEIYSFPRGQARYHGMVRLTVEAAVTEENCEQSVQAGAHQTRHGTLQRTDMDVAFPACTQIGDVLRLQNLFQDMRLASR